MNTKWFVSAMVSAGILISANSFAKEKELICHLSFDEGKGETVKDSSGNGNNGKILEKGRDTKWTEGKTGKALEFTGGDPKKRNNAGCVLIPKMNKYDFSKGLTVEAWVKFNDKRKQSSTCEIISNAVSERGTGFRLYLSWGAINLRSGEGGSGKIWQASSNAATNPIHNNVWYHVAGTYDGSVFKVYINGEEVGASKSGLTLTKGRKDIYIGSYAGGYTYGFNGIIDDVKIYNYAKSALDILKAAEPDAF